MRGSVERALWAAARYKGLEKPRGGMVPEVPRQEEARETQGELEGPGAPCDLESDWWLETWIKDSTLKTAIHSELNNSPFIPHLPPEPPRWTCSHESSTGGGMAVETVVVLMSPMMWSASRRA